MLDAGATVALATNCNPGSSYTTSMPFCIALAVRDLRMTADEAMWAATAGGAAALQRDDIGRLAPGSAPISSSSTPRPHPPRLPPGRPSGRHDCPGREHGVVDAGLVIGVAGVSSSP